MKCPRCSAAVTATPDELGFVVCSQCGAKLRSKAPVVVKVQGGTSALPQRAPQPGPAAVAPRSVMAAAPADIDSVLARLDGPPNPSATLPPGTPFKKIPRPEEARPAASPGASALLDTILTEVRAVRRDQEEILAILKGGTAAAEAVPEADLGLTEIDAPPPPSAPLRSRRRKTVLLIDDDPETREATLAAMRKAEIPATTAEGGNEGLAAIAMEKPDVIAMELGISGDMAGKDVINMIKATMEWLDIPIVLYTRVPVESQKEARTIHGADELVLKRQGPDALVAKVISLFRKG